jgi:hypothetical protein
MHLGEDEISSGIDPASNRNEYQESSWGGGGEGRLARKTDNVTAICEATV